MSRFRIKFHAKLRVTSGHQDRVQIIAPAIISAAKGLVLFGLVIVIITKAAMGCCYLYGFAMINSALPDLLTLIAFIVHIKDNYKNVLGMGFKNTRTFPGGGIPAGEKTGQNPYGKQHR